MPTPVSAARQCLTDEAARALDDAVAVARRRSHAQTTSLHAVSALLALPSSTLRDACSRARSCAYPPRLQFRALELSVGVSLDRLPSSKAVEEPPVSNSLMAAIKRSQANQRRHPESFHLHQIHTQQQTASVLKVELKYFILSILDDPIVSRVFGEAGFRSCDIKLAIIHPPISQASRFSRTRCPPIFLCNLPDSERNFSFPFLGGFGYGDEDANCRRIGEVLVKRVGRNPLLIGVCAGDALRSFTDCVKRCKSGVLPAEISGLRVICIEKAVSEFVSGGWKMEEMDSKLKEVFGMVQNSSGPGVVVNYGELSCLVSDGAVEDAVGFVVSQLTALLKLYGGKVWLIGAVATCEMHRKFVARFPAIEKDWDLHLLPITTSKSLVDGFGVKSSFMGSFVPFGGFFPSQSDFQSQLSSPDKPFTRCQQCNDKYEHEVTAIWKTRSPAAADRFEVDSKSKELEEYETGDDRSKLSHKVHGLQKKWNDICRLHHRPLFPTQFALDKERTGNEPSVTGERSVLVNLGLSRDLQRSLNTNPSRRELPETSEIVTQVSQSKESESLQQRYLHSDISVTTDLGLGTLYASTSEKKRKVSELERRKDCIQHSSGSNTAEFHRVSEMNPCQSSSFSDRQLDMSEFKSLWNAVNEKVSWQRKATSTIIETILRCRTGNGRRPSWSLRGDIWLTFLGPDKIGKRKIASALAEVMFGSRGNLISVDFGLQDRGRRSNSLFNCKYSEGYDERFRGKTVVDFVAEELSKKPYSVVLLENVEKADIQAKSCLSQAIMTGKFLDSRSRRITINNTIFVTTITAKKVEKNSGTDDKSNKFSEERILTAKNCQMQISPGCLTGNAAGFNDINVRVTGAQGNSKPLLSKKQKLATSYESTERESSSELQKKASMSYLDLNLPVEEIEDEIKDHDCDSDSISEGPEEALLDEFLEQVDEKVVFEAYDFDEAAEKLAREIDLQFKRVFGSEVILEIDYKVMVQIVAAKWLSEEKRAVEEWIEQVLHKGFVESHKKHQKTCFSAMKLICREDGVVKEQAPGVCLPEKIILS